MQLSVEPFITTNSITGGYAKLMRKDFRKFGHLSHDQFAKKLLGGDYGYVAMKKFRDYVRENLTINEEEN